MRSTGFCGQWSLMNAEVLFKESYTKESGGTYGPVSLDKHPTVKHTTASLEKWTNGRNNKAHDKRLLSCDFSSFFLKHFPILCFQLCFAYKGMLKDEIGLKFTYRNSQGETKKVTAKVSTIFTKGHK